MRKVTFQIFIKSLHFQTPSQKKRRLKSANHMEKTV